MKQIKWMSAIFAAVMLTALAGCASAPTHESTGQYVDDSVITTRVKTEFLKDPALKVAEINVETFKGVVQLSGFLTSQSEISRAVDVARNVPGVRSVKSDMRLK